MGFEQAEASHEFRRKEERNGRASDSPSRRRTVRCPGQRTEPIFGGKGRRKSLTSHHLLHIQRTIALLFVSVFFIWKGGFSPLIPPLTTRGG